jgi:lipopolysaccharide export system permease protein
MKKLDWYVFRGYLISYAICLVSLIGLFVVVDLSARLGDFMQSGRQNLPVYIFRYYMYNIPLIFGKVSPLITLLAAMFVMTKLKKGNELTPIMASGISVQKVLAPIVIFAGLVSFASLAMEQWTIPKISQILRERDLSAEKNKYQFYNLIHDRENGVLMFMIQYKPSEDLMEIVHLSKLDEKARETMHIYATRGRYARREKGWILEEGYVRRFDSQGIRLGDGRPEVFDRMVFKDTAILPFDVERGGHQGGVRPLTHLLRIWQANPQMSSLGVRFHFRASFPFANLILLMVGLPFVLRSRSRSFFLGAAMSGVVVAAFFAASYACLKLGYSEFLPPIFAGWLPTVLFGSAGSVTFRMIPT